MTSPCWESYKLSIIFVMGIHIYLKIRYLHWNKTHWGFKKGIGIHHIPNMISYSLPCRFLGPRFIKSLGPNNAIWRQRSGSTLAQVMACCLTAPSHYLNQCWLIIWKVQWYSSEDNFRSDISATNHWNKLGNYSYKIPLKYPRGQWVNGCKF